MTQSLELSIKNFKAKIGSGFANPYLRYAFYISLGFLSLLLAIGSVAAVLASFILLPPLLPAVIGTVSLGTIVAIAAMAPLGAIFFASTFSFFKAAGQFSQLRRSVHYVATGLNNAVNTAYATSGIAENSIQLGLEITPAAKLLGLVISAGQKVVGMLGFVLGFKNGWRERKEKYSEQHSYQRYFETAEKTRQALAQQVILSKEAIARNYTHPERQEKIKAHFTAWEKAKNDLNDKPEPKKVASRWEKAADKLADNFNNFKNYVRNIKLGYKIVFLAVGIPLLALTILPLLGVAVSPAIVPIILAVTGVVAPFVGIAFATMNYYRDKWEDKVFSENKALTDKFLAHERENYLLREEQLLHKQLKQLYSGQSSETNQQIIPKKDFSRKYPNPLKNAEYGRGMMYATATFTGWTTLAYSLFGLVCFAIGIKVTLAATLATGGLALPALILTGGIALLFTAISIGTIVRRFYKEYTQQQKRTEELAKYHELLQELEAYKDYTPALELKTKAFNKRSKTAMNNYADYKALSVAKKVESVDRETMSMLHLPLLSNSLSFTVLGLTLNPLALIALVIAIPLAIISAKVEKFRMKRDKALDDLKFTNKMMQIELEQRKAAKARQEIVERAKDELSKGMGNNGCTAEPGDAAKNMPIQAQQGQAESNVNTDLEQGAKNDKCRLTPKPKPILEPKLSAEIAEPEKEDQLITIDLTKEVAPKFQATHLARFYKLATESQPIRSKTCAEEELQRQINSEYTAAAPAA